MQVAAHVARAAAFHKVHAHRHKAVVGVHLHVVRWMGKAAVAGRSLTVAALVLPADLMGQGSEEDAAAGTNLQSVRAVGRLGHDRGRGVDDSAKVRQLVRSGHEARDEGDRCILSVSRGGGQVGTAGGGRLSVGDKGE